MRPSSAWVLSLPALSSGRSSRRSALFALDDAEALARMLASENPSGDEALWTEQIYTQIRNAGSRSLADTLTGGTGVTARRGTATRGNLRARDEEDPRICRAVSNCAAAVAARRGNSIFEPAQQIAPSPSPRKRDEKALGLPLSAQELRLLAYKERRGGHPSALGQVGPIHRNDRRCGVLDVSPDFFDLRPSSALVWPVPLANLRRVGQSVLSDRDGKGSRTMALICSPLLDADPVRRGRSDRSRGRWTE